MEEIIESLKITNMLEDLSLTVDITNECGRLIGSYLSKNTSLTSLCLRTHTFNIGGTIAGNGMFPLVRALAHNNTLRVLSLRSYIDKQIDYPVWLSYWKKELANALAVNYALRMLDLRKQGNDVVPECLHMEHAIKFVKVNRSLYSLYVGSTVMEDMIGCMREFFDALKENFTLKDLSMCIPVGNKIGKFEITERECEIIKPYLESTKTLKSLMFSKSRL